MPPRSDDSEGRAHGTQGRGSGVMVVKFGGTSLGGTERMGAAARIVAAHCRDQSVVCVVSAVAGVTDALMSTTEQATRGDTAWQATVAEISTRHQDTLDELTRTTGTAPTITSRFATAQAALAADIQRMLATPFATEEARVHAVAAYSGWGERLAALLFAQALAGEGVAAAPFVGEPVALVAHPGLAASASIGDMGEPRRHQRPDRSAARLAPSVAATRELPAPHVEGWRGGGVGCVPRGNVGRPRAGPGT